MKLYDRYIVQSIVSVAFVALLLCTLMLLSYDLFSNLDAYLTSQVPALTIAHLTVLAIPESVLFAVGPSLLFSATFFLSQLQANNEYICLLGSGLSYRRIVAPILVLALIFSLLQFAFNEQLAIPIGRSKETIEDQIMGLRGSYDNRNITLTDPEGNYVVYAKHYNDNQKRLSQVLLVMLDDSHMLSERIDASFAVWNDQEQAWNLEEVRRQVIDREGLLLKSTEQESLMLEEFTLSPAYFRNLSNDITTMDLGTAFHYLKRMQELSPLVYPALATDVAKRILGNLNPLVMLFIACTISYKYKKNVLLFSIITSLAIAVIYYVVQMVTLIMAKQAVIGPIWGMAIPMIVIVCIALAERSVIR